MQEPSLEFSEKPHLKDLTDLSWKLPENFSRRLQKRDSGEVHLWKLLETFSGKFQKTSLEDFRGVLLRRTPGTLFAR